jgi:hypothetical protein
LANKIRYTLTCKYAWQMRKHFPWILWVRGRCTGDGRLIYGAKLRSNTTNVNFITTPRELFIAINGINKKNPARYCSISQGIFGK